MHTQYVHSTQSRASTWDGTWFWLLNQGVSLNLAVYIIIPSGPLYDIVYCFYSSSMDHFCRLALVDPRFCHIVLHIEHLISPSMNLLNSSKRDFHTPHEYSTHFGLQGLLVTFHWYRDISTFEYRDFIYCIPQVVLLGTSTIKPWSPQIFFFRSTGWISKFWDTTFNLTCNFQGSKKQTLGVVIHVETLETVIY